MANDGHSGVRNAVGDGAGSERARAVLWLVVTALAVRQVAAVLRLPPSRRLTDLETWTGADGVLHLGDPLYATGMFTDTPFAGLVLKPLTRSAEASLGVAWTFGTLLLVVALGTVVARALPGPLSRRTRQLGAPCAISLLMLSLPVRNTLHLGQTSIIPVLLVLLGFFVAGEERGSGLLIGFGAALQPIVLLFVPLLWLTGRRRAAVSTAATFAVCTALAWAVMARDSWTYWAHHVAGTGLGAHPEGLADQSLHGALLRFGLAGPLEIAVFLVLAVLVTVLGLLRAVRYARDGQLLLAVAVTGCVTVAVSPATWQHQLLWVLLAVVGRVGRRAADRMVWPAVVVLVMTLPGTMLLPNIAAVYPVRDNAVLLTALAAACAVPFLERASPHWGAAVPTVYAEPAPARWRAVPLLRFWRRVTTRPNLLLELLAIRVGYSVYSHIRAAATGGRATAESHGRTVVSIEQTLHIDIEHWANHAVAKIQWLDSFLSFYYETFHFIVPLAILGALYVRRPADYRWARTSLSFATLLGLVGFFFFPLAPPRLMPGLGFIDTVHGVQDLAHPDYGAMTAMTNQYAAMPSLHFGWALWCGVVVALLVPKRTLKVIAMLHPLLTVSAIVATANHWVLDAIGGATVVVLGFGLTHLLAGRRTLLPPRVLPGPRPAPPAVQPEASGAV
ncbi:bifunctional glycosyltransferase 87/phosphatase PAP2 family protein [Streptomyces sp. NBC_00344]|uniref:bifunctional glycosyltransferase 87/phosphatase PAP2 family protein n=1 Tax=Streptomyces sp. NBC_00344 TaxID=2975720 RepID=UPI003FA6CE82